MASQKPSVRELMKQEKLRRALLSQKSASNEAEEAISEEFSSEKPVLRQNSAKNPQKDTQFSRNDDFSERKKQKRDSSKVIGRVNVEISSISPSYPSSRKDVEDAATSSSKSILENNEHVSVFASSSFDVSERKADSFLPEGFFDADVTTWGRGGEEDRGAERDVGSEKDVVGGEYHGDRDVGGGINPKTTGESHSKQLNLREPDHPPLHKEKEEHLVKGKSLRDEVDDGNDIHISYEITEPDASLLVPLSKNTLVEEQMKMEGNNSAFLQGEESSSPRTLHDEVYVHPFPEADGEENSRQNHSMEQSDGVFFSPPAIDDTPHPPTIDGISPPSTLPFSQAYNDYFNDIFTPLNDPPESLSTTTRYSTAPTHQNMEPLKPSLSPPQTSGGSGDSSFLPEGFFDDEDLDARARGVEEPSKRRQRLAEEKMKELQKLASEKLKEAAEAQMKKDHIKFTKSQKEFKFEQHILMQGVAQFRQKWRNLMGEGDGGVVEGEAPNDIKREGGDIWRVSSSEMLKREKHQKLDGKLHGGVQVKKERFTAKKPLSLDDLKMQMKVEEGGISGMREEGVGGSRFDGKSERKPGKMEVGSEDEEMDDDPLEVLWDWKVKSLNGRG